jgi:hypothetical protein
MVGKRVRPIDPFFNWFLGCAHAMVEAQMGLFANCYSLADPPVAQQAISKTY